MVDSHDADYQQAKRDLATTTKNLTALQKVQEEKDAKVTELSANPTLEDAKAAVKEKRKTLDALVRGLKTKKKEDALTAESDALDNEAVLRENIIIDQELEAKIWELNLDLEEETYVAEIGYKGCRYICNGMIPLEELEKILKSAYFL